RGGCIRTRLAGSRFCSSGVGRCSGAIGFVREGLARGLRRILQGVASFSQRLAYAFARVFDRTAYRARSVLHLVFELVHLIQIDFALDIGLYLVDVALRAAKQVADSARYFRQTFG